MPEMRKFLLVIFLFLSTLAGARGVASAKFTETLLSYAVRVRSDSLQDTKNLALLVSLLARETDRMLHFTGSPQQNLTIHLLEKPEPELPEPENLFLSRQDQPIQIFFVLSKALIQRRIRDFLPRGSLNLESSDWLAGALCNRVYYDG